MIGQGCLELQRQLQGYLGWARSGTLTSRRNESRRPELSGTHGLPAEYAIRCSSAREDNFLREEGAGEDASAL